MGSKLLNTNSKTESSSRPTFSPSPSSLLRFEEETRKARGALLRQGRDIQLGRFVSQQDIDAQHDLGQAGLLTDGESEGDRDSESDSESDGEPEVEEEEEEDEDEDAEGESDGSRCSDGSGDEMEDAEVKVPLWVIEQGRLIELGDLMSCEDINGEHERDLQQEDLFDLGRRIARGELTNIEELNDQFGQ